ncbi:MAG: helix-turn-helix domain-containing protein, partial [Gemmatimonadaceae bacterium]
MKARHTLVIVVRPGETYQDSLRRRLSELDITQKAICDELGIDPSQFSRWVARPSADTGEPVDIGSGWVVEI